MGRLPSSEQNKLPWCRTPVLAHRFPLPIAVAAILMHENAPEIWISHARPPQQVEGFWLALGQSYDYTTLRLPQDTKYLGDTVDPHSPHQGSDALARF